MKEVALLETSSEAVPEGFIFSGQEQGSGFTKFKVFDSKQERGIHRKL